MQRPAARDHGQPRHPRPPGSRMWPGMWSCRRRTAWSGMCRRRAREWPTSMYDCGHDAANRVMLGAHDARQIPASMS